MMSASGMVSTISSDSRHWRMNKNSIRLANSTPTKRLAFRLLMV